MLLRNMEKWAKYQVRRRAMLLKYKLGSKEELIPAKGPNKRLESILKGFEIERPSKNVLIVVIDCFRYWSTSQSGYERDTTPFFDDFGKLLKAHAPAPWTYPSVPSILSGLYPHRHGAFLRGEFKNFTKLDSLKPLRPSVPLITDVLERAGYGIYVATAIDPVSYSLRGRVDVIQHHYLTPAGRVLRRFVEWVAREGKPFFAYLHLGDPHEPLNPPKEYRNYFGKVKTLPNIDTWNYHFQWERERDPKGFEKYRFYRVLLYDNVLRYVNDALEWLVEELEKRKLLDDTLVVVTADHGEEFWEHAKTEAEHFRHAKGWSGISHGHNVFAEIIDVPLLLGGYVERPVRAGTPRSLVDIVPTVLDTLGIGYPRGFFNGVSLFRERKKPVLSEGVSSGYEKKALIDGRYKLLHAPGDGVKWVFDYVSDSRDIRPLENAGALMEMEKKLKMLMVSGIGRGIRL
ncbi:sulfatase [Thermococcus sp.]|uniref:sulfatase n=1 Tax=Thermococcus sp. TaxID=35749 RepID=UPI002618151B|nr:sulfatase [Thermococcus sp.]